MIFGGLDIVWDHRGELLDGFINTTLLSILGIGGALLLGVLLAMLLMARMRVVARSATLFVDLMRCTPFLLFVYLVYYALPSLGVRLDNWTAGLLALVIYNAAYVGEAIRGGWVSLPRDGIEAGHAFGFYGLQLIRRVVLPPVFVATVPVLGNQAIQIVKDSSFLTIIAVPELTAAANSLQSNYYIPFAAFLAAILLYWLLCSGIELLVALHSRSVRFHL